MPAPILPERPVLVAPDAFTGVGRAARVAAAIGRGLERSGLMAPDLCPVADGGPGTLDAVLPSLGGEVVAHPTRAGTASLVLVADGRTALVEPPPAAAAPATSHATGELLCAAADAGAAVVVLTGGGALAADGGTGAREAIDAGAGLGGARLVLLREPFAPLAEPLATLPGALVEPGIAWVLDVLDFDARMLAARAVVTGEGVLDEQSLRGGIVGEIGRRTRQAGVPLHGVVGQAELDRFGRRMIDLQRVFEAGTLAEIEAAGERLGQELLDGRA